VDFLRKSLLPDIVTDWSVFFFVCDILVGIDHFWNRKRFIDS
jgi:hypothetical protein